VPFLSTLRTPETSFTGCPSAVDQSILGCGLPEAEQSSQAPLEFENSILDGGSSWKLGPRKCASKLCPPADVTTAVTPGRERERHVC